MGSFDDLFNEALAIPAEICRAMQEGNLPEGSRVYRRDITDDNGNKVGEKIVRTYSYGRNRPPKDIVRSDAIRVNIIDDNEGRKTYEFACAGYDPKNISFEINKENPDYIDLVLSSGVKTEEPKAKEEPKAEEKSDAENTSETEEPKVESKTYEVQGFTVKDTRVPFKVDNTRYNIEEPIVEFEFGVVRITFEPKKINFNPKFKK